jgi:hypothetical protein
MLCISSYPTGALVRTLYNFGNYLYKLAQCLLIQDFKMIAPTKKSIAMPEPLTVKPCGRCRENPG